MKLNRFCTIQKNKRNKQTIFCVRVKALKRVGMTPQELYNAVVLKPIKNVKNKKGRK